MVGRRLIQRGILNKFSKLVFHLQPS